MHTVYKGSHYSATMSGDGVLVVSSRKYETRMHGDRAKRFAAELANMSAAEATHRIGRAMDFRVGGDQNAIDAKGRLRELEAVTI